MNVSEELKNAVLSSPKVSALDELDFMSIAADIQSLGDAAQPLDVPEGHTLMDYAFIGYLWSKGLLDGVTPN